MNKNMLNQQNDNNIITKDIKIYNPKKDKDLKIRKKAMNYSIINSNNNNNLNSNFNNNNLLSPKVNITLLKELNFEDFYLLMQKFEIIKNNIILLGNL
jgi:UDP-N-acetylglucosamine 2-epimerase